MFSYTYLDASKSPYSMSKATLTFPIHIFTGMVLPLIFIIAATTIVATTIIIISRFTSGKAAQRLTVKWAQLVLRLMRISCSIENTTNIDSSAFYIITPNHQSIMDFLPLLSTLPMRFRWVSEKRIAEHSVIRMGPGIYRSCLHRPVQPRQGFQGDIRRLGKTQ